MGPGGRCRWLVFASLWSLVFGIRAQMRRAAVSVATNLVEGNARRGTKDYLSFLNISRGSAAELEYLIGLALELELLPPPCRFLQTHAASIIPQLEALIQKMEILLLQEEGEKKQKRRTR